MPHFLRGQILLNPGQVPVIPKRILAVLQARRARGHNEAKAKRSIYIQRLLTKYSNTYGAY